MSVRIIDKMPLFKQHLYSVFDDALREIARDILIKSREVTPYDKGALRAQSYSNKISEHHHRVLYNMEYARFQEAGGDSKRQIRKYTTPGTKAHYLESTGDKYTGLKLAGVFKKHGARVKV